MVTCTIKCCVRTAVHLGICMICIGLTCQTSHKQCSRTSNKGQTLYKGHDLSRIWNKDKFSLWRPSDCLSSGCPLFRSSTAKTNHTLYWTLSVLLWVTVLSITATALFPTISSTLSFITITIFLLLLLLWLLFPGR